MRPSPAFSPELEEAGSKEPFEDPVLYDFEYRRRRADVNFYRRLAEEKREARGQVTILDLACGTGRLTLPLLRDGHTVVGLDRSRPMLARAQARLLRLRLSRRGRALLLRADLRAFSLRPGANLAICAFHSLQHLVDDRDILAFFRGVKQALLPDGWFAFDVLPADPAWIARDPGRRWGRTVFRHPGTGQRLLYTTNHLYDPVRRAAHIRLYLQPLDEKGRRRGPERLVRLCHRQFQPFELERLLGAAGFEVLSTFGGFDARPLDPDDVSVASQLIYVARPRPRSTGGRTKRPPPGRGQGKKPGKTAGKFA